MSTSERIETLGQQCPVCNKPDWCLRLDAAVICGRIETCELPTCNYCRSGRPKRAGGGGWLHVTGKRRFRCRGKSTRHRVPDWEHFEKLHAEFRADIQHQQFAWLARQLGVTAESLDRLEMGWSDSYTIGASFPLRNSIGRICGISVRSVHGRKTCVRGSALGSGLFVPSDLNSDGKLFLAEGASDTAALLSIGLQAIGRPSTSTDPEVVRRYLNHGAFKRIVVVADNDSHGAGQSAARSLANYLKHFMSCSLLIPRVKDVRDWIRQGADRNQVMEDVQDVN